MIFESFGSGLILEARHTCVNTIIPATVEAGLV
jgi:hypothetical protein